jgi:hypothetical protein
VFVESSGTAENSKGSLTFKGVDTTKIFKVTNDVESLLNIIGQYVFDVFPETEKYCMN